MEEEAEWREERIESGCRLAAAPYDKMGDRVEGARRRTAAGAETNQGTRRAGCGNDTGPDPFADSLRCHGRKESVAEFTAQVPVTFRSYSPDDMLAR